MTVISALFYVIKTSSDLEETDLILGVIVCLWSVGYTLYIYKTNFSTKTTKILNLELIMAEKRYDCRTYTLSCGPV